MTYSQQQQQKQKSMMMESTMAHRDYHGMHHRPVTTFWCIKSFSGTLEPQFRHCGSLFYSAGDEGSVLTVGLYFTPLFYSSGAAKDNKCREYKFGSEKWTGTS
jgi:hypothetical protein